MNDHPAPNHGPRFQIDEWIQSALRGELMSIVESDWLDICHIDRVTRSLDELRLLTGIPERTVPREKLYPGVALLHCVRYEEMSKPTLDGLPSALLQVLGLDERSGPYFLGAQRWQEVAQRFHSQPEYKQGSAATTASCKAGTGHPENQGQDSQANHGTNWMSSLKSLLRPIYAASSTLRNFLNPNRGKAIVQPQPQQDRGRASQEAYEHVHRVAPCKPPVDNVADDFPCAAARQVLADVMRKSAWPHERALPNGMHDLGNRRVPQRPRPPSNRRKNPRDPDADGCDDDDITA